MKIKAIEVNQNNSKFYICAVNAKKLSYICSTSMQEIVNDTDVFQRQLNEERRKRITSFANRSRALFPTAIVLNSRSNIQFSNGELELNENPNSYFIIDGQHRIFGIKDSRYDYELCVVVVNVDTDLQSELFITINSEQKTVNPNVRFNMKSNDKVGTPEKEIRNIAEMLNGDEQSPLYNKIWLDDKPRNKDNVKLSLGAFCEPLCNYIYNSKYYYEFKDLLIKTSFNKDDVKTFGKEHKFDKKILWNCYVNRRMDVVHRILLNYFRAISVVYDKEWVDLKSIMLKTIGFNAFILLFVDIFKICQNNNNDFSCKNIIEILNQHKVDSSYFYTSKNASVGKVGAVELYKELRKGITDSVIEYENIDYITDDDIESYKI